MKANSKVKLVFSLAILLIVMFLVISIWQLVVINKKQQQIESQRQEISRLTDLNDYYKNHTAPSGDGSDLTTEGKR